VGSGESLFKGEGARGCQLPFARLTCCMFPASLKLLSLIAASPLGADSLAAIVLEGGLIRLSATDRPSEFLLGRNPGPYTVLRTVDLELPSQGTLDFHLDRLISSSDYAAVDVGRLRCSTLHALAACTCAWRDEGGRLGCPSCRSDAVLTCLWEEHERGEVNIICHASLAPPLEFAAPGPGILVESRIGCRPGPQHKHSSWVRDRKPLERIKGGDASETVMTSASGQVLEGLVSNVFVVRNAVLCTTGTGVLPGHMRSLCLQAASELDLPWDAHASLNIAELTRSEWSEAFITSSVSVIKPIASWRLATGETFSLRSTNPSSLTLALQQHILRNHFNLKE
jgi:branched-subunit amino acid aminotransferase/4-amino-4-deoxychorismate lyase